MRADGIDNDGNFFASLEQAECGGLYCAFDADADKDKFACLDLAEKPVDARLIEGVEAAFVKDDLLVTAEQVARKVGAAICGEAGPIVEEGVADFFLAFGAVYAADGDIGFAVWAGINVGY